MIASELKLPITVEKLRKILRSRGVVKAGIFGSYARGKAHAGSDLDIVVDYQDGVSLFDHFDLKEELEATTGKKVDIVSSYAVSSHLKPYIDKESVKIL